jgi:hypothetical protein
MKIPPSLARLLILSAGPVAALVFSARVAAQTVPVIVFTEESSTLLTATLGGNSFGTVTLNSPDHWTWLVPSDRPNGAGGSALNPFEYWSEPGAPTSGNTLNSTFVGLRAGISIISDLDFTGSSNRARPDGYVSVDKFQFEYVGGSSEIFSVQFFDHGDTAIATPGEWVHVWPCSFSPLRAC